MTKDTLTQDNEPNPWRSIGLQAALIVNKLRCDARLRELATEETAPPKQGNFSNGGQKQSAPLIVGAGTGLTIQNEGAEYLKPEHAANDPLRNAHASAPHENKDEQSSRDTGSGKTDEQRAKDHRDAVDERLRALRTFERRVNGRDQN